jgi:hypothetical protein
VVGESFEVLHDGCEGEFVTGSAATPQAKSLKTVVAFEVCELHLDLFALVAGLLVFRRSHERAGDIACILVDVADDASGGHVRAALRLERARSARWYGGQIAERMIGMEMTGRGYPEREIWR